MTLRRLLPLLFVAAASADPYTEMGRLLPERPVLAVVVPSARALRDKTRLLDPPFDLVERFRRSARAPGDADAVDPDQPWLYALSRGDRALLETQATPLRPGADAPAVARRPGSAALATDRYFVETECPGYRVRETPHALLASLPAGDVVVRADVASILAGERALVDLLLRPDSIAGALGVPTGAALAVGDLLHGARDWIGGLTFAEATLDISRTAWDFRFRVEGPKEAEPVRAGLAPYLRALRREYPVLVGIEADLRRLAPMLELTKSALSDEPMTRFGALFLASTGAFELHRARRALFAADVGPTGVETIALLDVVDPPACRVAYERTLDEMARGVPAVRVLRGPDGVVGGVPTKEYRLHFGGDGARAAPAIERPLVLRLAPDAPPEALSALETAVRSRLATRFRYPSQLPLRRVRNGIVVDAAILDALKGGGWDLLAGPGRLAVRRMLYHERPHTVEHRKRLEKRLAAGVPFEEAREAAPGLRWFRSRPGSSEYDRPEPYVLCRMDADEFGRDDLAQVTLEQFGLGIGIGVDIWTLVLSFRESARAHLRRLSRSAGSHFAVLLDDVAIATKDSIDADELRIHLSFFHKSLLPPVLLTLPEGAYPTPVQAEVGDRGAGALFGSDEWVVRVGSAGTTVVIASGGSSDEFVGLLELVRAPRPTGHDSVEDLLHATGGDPGFLLHVDVGALIDRFALDAGNPAGSLPFLLHANWGGGAFSGGIRANVAGLVRYEQTLARERGRRSKFEGILRGPPETAKED